MSKALATKNVAAVLLGVALVVTFAFLVPKHEQNPQPISTTSSTEQSTEIALKNLYEYEDKCMKVAEEDYLEYKGRFDFNPSFEGELETFFRNPDFDQADLKECSMLIYPKTKKVYRAHSYSEESIGSIRYIVFMMK